jgi:capsule polysaccharide export protein KpsE/RkpR
MDDLQHTDAHAEYLDEAERAEILDESAMVDALRRYRIAREELDVQKRRAKEYIEQVKAETEAELAPLEARLDRLRASLQNFIEEHNAGERFKCAGLGTVYTSRGFSITVADERTLLGYVESECPGECLDRVFPRKLSASAARRLAQEELEQTGEQIPGVEAEAKSTLNVRLSKAALAPERPSPA